jgi:hypothetical protein
MLQLPHDPVPLHSVATEVVAQWPPGTFLENLALDSDGESWLVTSPFNQTIYRARADGTTQAATKFDQWVTGIVSHPQGPLAAVGTQGQADWRLHRITDVAAQAVCELPGVLFANGMAWAGARLLVVDSLRSVVLAVRHPGGRIVGVARPPAADPDATRLPSAGHQRDQSARRLGHHHQHPTRPTGAGARRKPATAA